MQKAKRLRCFRRFMSDGFHEKKKICVQLRLLSYSRHLWKIFVIYNVDVFSYLIKMTRALVHWRLLIHGAFNLTYIAFYNIFRIFPRALLKLIFSVGNSKNKSVTSSYSSYNVSYFIPTVVDISFEKQ